MLNKKVMVLTIFLVILLAISAVSAADNITSDVVSLEDATEYAVSVDELADEVVSAEDSQVILEGDADVGTFDELSIEINSTEVNGVFNLTKNYEYVNGSTEGINISKAITIDGKNHTINGNSLSRIFNIQSSNVILKNLIFINGFHGKYGGAILCDGSDISFSNCYFLNCTVQSQRGVCAGAIYFKSGSSNLNSNFNITGCKFSNCSAVSSSGASCGAIGNDYSNENMHVTNCVFIDCFSIAESVSSGAIENPGLLENCSFIHCFIETTPGEGSCYGGAIQTSKGKIIGCDFLNCYCFKVDSVDTQSHGGAIAIMEGSQVYGCNFVNCSVLACAPSYNSENLFAMGGAIFSQDSNARVSNSTFINCSSFTPSPSTGFKAEGGAISGEYIGINDCIFINCSANSSSTNSYGGAICIYFDNSNIENCTFINNTAFNGGAISGHYLGQSILKNSSFINNSANYGGSIFIQESGYSDGQIYTSILDSNFTNNVASNLGNSIYSVDSYLFVKNLLFTPAFDNIVSNNGDLNIVKRKAVLKCNNSSFYCNNPNIFSVILEYNQAPLYNESLIIDLTCGGNNKNFAVNTNNDGIAAIYNELFNLTVGEWIVTVNFEGNDNYVPCNVTATITVLPPSTSLTIDDVNATVGHEVTLVANVNSNLTVNEGVVTFLDGETNIGEANVYDGVATLTYAPTTDGEHIITAIFNSANYLSSNSTAKLLVDSATVEVLVTNGAVGFESNFVANVKGLYSIINEGNVVFNIGDEYLGTVAVVNGSANISYVPLIAKDYTVKAVFTDSVNFLDDEDSAIFTVYKADTGVIINDFNATVGHEFVITADVVSSNNLTLNEGLVTFFDGETGIGEAYVSNGVATLAYVPATGGEHTITAIYNSANYLSSNSTAKLLVDSATVEVLVTNGAVGFESNFVANVKGLYSIINEGNVVFNIGDEYLGTVAVVNGSANISYVPLIAKDYTIKAVFTDSINFLDYEDTNTFKVARADARIIINDFNATVGHEFIITANVVSSNNLTINEGYIVFFDNQTSIGEANLNNGVATLRYTPATSGKRPVTAMYYASNYQDPIESSLLNVSKANVDLSIDNIDSVYFTNPSRFKVNVISNYNAVSEGEIKFYVNGAFVGSSSVYNGKANFDYITNSTGSFTLVVIYNETNNYLASDTTAYFEVNKMPTILSGESVIFDEQQYKTFTTELKDKNNLGVNGKPVKIEVIKYSGESATFNGISDANGITIYDVGRLAGGMWYVTGIYAGDENYIDSRFVDKFIVVRMDTTTEIEEIENPKVNHTYKLKANIHDENGKLVKEGIVQFYLDGVDIGSIDLSNNNGHQNALGILGAVDSTFEYKLGIDDSEVYLNYIPKRSGNFNLTAVYEGTTIYKSSKSTTTFTVSEDSVVPEITIPPLDNPSNYGSVKVTLPSDAQGTVILNVNNQNYTFEVKDGVANVILPKLDDGNYSYSITYSGDKKYSSFTNKGNMNVNNVMPTVMTVSAATTVYNGGKYLTIILKGENGTLLNDVKVTVKFSNGNVFTPTIKNGRGKVSTNGIAPVKICTATITFAGNAKYSPSSKKVTFTVKKATPKLTAKAKTFKRSVKTKKYSITLKTNQKKALAGVKVTIKVNKKIYSAKTNKNGVATFKLTKLTKKGKYAAVVKFAGNKYYNAKTAKPKITIK